MGGEHKGYCSSLIWLLICRVTLLVWEMARPTASSTCRSCAPAPPSLGLGASEHLDYRSGFSLRNLSSSKLKVRKWEETEQSLLVTSSSISQVLAFPYFLHYWGHFPSQLLALRPSGSSTKPRNNSLTYSVPHCVRCHLCHLFFLAVLVL